MTAPADDARRDAVPRLRSTPTRTRRPTGRSTRRVPLRDVWAGERRDALFLYLHIPFCEMRCGFCNLFTTAEPAGRRRSTRYLDALERAGATRCGRRSAPARVRPRSRIGGGTPTYLDARRAATGCSTSPSACSAPTCAAIPIVGRDVAGDGDRRTGCAVLRGARRRPGQHRRAELRRRRGARGRPAAAAPPRSTRALDAHPRRRRSRRSTST